MKDNYDFFMARKNPYSEKIKKGYAITVHYEFEGDQSAELNEDSEDKKSIIQAQ